MYSKKSFVIFAIVCLFSMIAFSQSKLTKDSMYADSLHEETEQLLIQSRQQKLIDSLLKSQLQKDLLSAANDKQKTKELEDKISRMAIQDSIQKAAQYKRLSELKKRATRFAVAPFSDTLFYIYTKIGSFIPQERAVAINQRIIQLYEDPFFQPDSLKISESDDSYDILYNNEKLVLSITSLDALWLNKGQKLLANEYLDIIKKSIIAEKKANSFDTWLKHFALVLIIIAGLAILIFLINKIFKHLTNLLNQKKDRYLKGLTFRKIKILSAEQLQQVAIKIKNILRVAVIILSIYLSLPLLFNIFPETKTWTGKLLEWIFTPTKSALNGIMHFLPNLFTILVIYFLFRYAIKVLKYFVDEIDKGNITISGFHADWAQTTFNITKFMLYAFMLVLIFPYLPGSGSAAFRGISVFVGVIFSLGSSSAISNMVAGLVITYMRPFKIGDRITIGEITGDVIEKTMLVTRIRTIKNEDVTLPNSAVLSGNTINYSNNTKPEDKGLILHTTVTIGYDVPWQEVHQALIKAALRTDMILSDPTPFVLQTGLDDFYVSYQINGYSKEANKQANIYSDLHKNIQDCCNEAGIEILSPHYRQLRDGNMTTIPKDYLDKNYEVPEFNIKIKNDQSDNGSPS